MNDRTAGLIASIALLGSTLYWRRRERRVEASLTASREWETATNHDHEEIRAARQAADHLDARVVDLPERVDVIDEERRDLRREVDAVRERWADAAWTARCDGTAEGDPPVRVVEFERGELPDARAFAKRALDGDGITIVAAQGDGSYAIAVGEASSAFSATEIARELATEIGGGAGGDDRLAVGGGATDGLGEGCRHFAEKLLDSDAARIA